MESKIELYKALANFQQTCPIIHKATQGHNYTYATLDSIIKTINPIMAKNGLGFTQLIEGDNKIKTIVFHCESGQEISSVITMPENVAMKGMNPMQSLGSNITYCKRYALGSMLGVITDKDIDGAGSQVEPNGVDHPNVDPYAEGKELCEQIKKAILSISKEIEPTAPIQLEDLDNYTEQALREQLREYMSSQTDLRAEKWYADQLTKPKKTGTIEALRELVVEARRRGFYTPSVELKITELAGELAGKK